MTVKDLETFFDYCYWANEKLRDVAAQLTLEAFTKPIMFSYRPVRNTLVHILSAAWGWQDRCGGAARGDALNPSDNPTQTSLARQWRQVEGHVREFLRFRTTRLSLYKAVIDLEKAASRALGYTPKSSATMVAAVRTMAGRLTQEQIEKSVFEWLPGYSIF